MRRLTTIVKGRRHVIKAVGQRPGAEIFALGPLGLVLNISLMHAAATARPHIFRPLSFTVAEATETIARYPNLDRVNADRIPLSVIHSPGIAIRQGGGVAFVIDGHHRLDRLYREGYSGPWICHGFTVAQARLFAVRYYEAVGTGGWREIPFSEIESRGHWRITKTAKAALPDLIEALAG